MGKCFSATDVVSFTKLISVLSLIQVLEGFEKSSYKIIRLKKNNCRFHSQVEAYIFHNSKIKIQDLVYNTKN